MGLVHGGAAGVRNRVCAEKESANDGFGCAGTVICRRFINDDLGGGI